MNKAVLVIIDEEAKITRGDQQMTRPDWFNNHHFTLSVSAYSPIFDNVALMGEIESNEAEDTYNTIRRGCVREIHLPCGTTRQGPIIDPISQSDDPIKVQWRSSLYSRSAVYMYRLPSGLLLRAGGGGPSYPDIVEVKQ
jgi:hypothetical protein